MSSVFNFANQLTSGNLRLAKAGRELYGTVVRAGISKKTVTVKVNRFFYDQKYSKTYSRTGLFHVHDEDEFCTIGDKVVIQSCRPMSKSKKYFIRNVVVMAGRPFELGAINADKKVQQLEDRRSTIIEQLRKERQEEIANSIQKLSPLWEKLEKDMKNEERLEEFGPERTDEGKFEETEGNKDKSVNKGGKEIRRRNVEKEMEMKEIENKE